VTTYTNIFGANSIAPALSAYNSIALTAPLTLVWPLETAPNSNLCTPIIDISSATTGAFSLTLPPASQVGQGTFLIINNLSSYAQAIYNNAGAVIVASQAPGSTFFYYIQSNATAAGSWGAFQYGAQISAPSAAGLAGPGIRAVGSTLGQDIVVNTYNTSQTLGYNSQAQMFNWNGGTGAFTLPLASVAGANWYVQFRNSGTGILTITNSGSDVINGIANLSMNPNDSCFMVCDGTTWWTIGLGPSISVLNLNPVTISLAGLSGTVTLSGSQLNRIIYTLTGAPTANINIVVPSTAQEYWVRNATTGGFTITIGTSGQVSPPSITASSQSIYYCDGSNVYLATPAGLISSVPVSVAQGGTGGTTAAQALSNLGGGAVGIAVFDAASNATAQQAMAASSVADAFVFANVM
jgi:hypothetical protein